MKASHDPTEWLPGFAQAQTGERQPSHTATHGLPPPPEHAATAHPWDTGGRGPTGSSTAGVPVLFCPRCRVTFYLRPDRPKCPSCSQTPTALVIGRAR